MKVQQSACPEPERVAQISPRDLAPRSLSIVVFGPGHGEAIVVFLPDGSVGVVDGCREPTKGRVDGRGDPVRELLSAYEEIEPGFRIRFVCLTHHHADHYRGLGHLMNTYAGRIESAWDTPLVSGQYRSQILEFERSIPARSGKIPDDEERVKGLERVFREFETFNSQSPLGYQNLAVNKELIQETMLDHALLVTGWAAHDSDLRTAIKQFAWAVEAAAKVGKVQNHDPNRMSGALSITWGKAGVLLAGDTLRSDGTYVGWSGALGLAGKYPIQVVNVAHHASVEAHDHELWEKMSPHLAIVTPFQHATGAMPPRPEQIKEIATSCTVAITSPPDWPDRENNPKPATSQRPLVTTKMQAVQEPTRPASHAVGVSLDPDGNITKFLLAKGADVFR